MYYTSRSNNNCCCVCVGSRGPSSLPSAAGGIREAWKGKIGGGISKPAVDGRPTGPCALAPTWFHFSPLLFPPPTAPHEIESQNLRSIRREDEAWRGVDREERLFLAQIELPKQTLYSRTHLMMAQLPGDAHKSSFFFFQQGLLLLLMREERTTHTHVVWAPPYVCVCECT